MDSAFFPYGEKSKEFLLKRSLYLCYILTKYKVDRIILACNTLSLISLPFLKTFYNISGVFDSFKDEITPSSVIIGSKSTINVLKDRYKCLLLDGSDLIYALEKNLDYQAVIKKLNENISRCDKIILACTHFLKLKKNSFCIKELRNI